MPGCCAVATSGAITTTPRLPTATRKIIESISKATSRRTVASDYIRHLRYNRCMLALILSIISALLWLIILLLPWQPWRNREVLEREIPIQLGPYDLSDMTVVIPARNEATVIGPILSALAEQGRHLSVVMVDDCSTDGTADVARQIPGLNLTIVTGEALPEGWAGKPWALSQGIRRVQTPYTLLLDADIRLAPGAIYALRSLMQRQGSSLVSVMAALHMRSFWEKLLIPAFIYFFKMLYPFGLANTSNRHFASAAGGCILLETRLFPEIGGMESIRSALIDDCALAARVKQIGVRTWIGLSRAVECIRPYTGLGEIWNMIARSAYTQLRYSPLILGLCTFFLVVLFWMPILGLFSPDTSTRLLSLAAGLGMLVAYLPTLLFYGLSPAWALLLPLTSGLYLSMTWSSAIRYYRGVRSRWKGRVYH